MCNKFLCFFLLLGVCVAFSVPVIAEEETVPGVIVKLKHKIAKKGDVLVVHVLANDIGSDDPRPVALWLSTDQTLEQGDRFLAEDTISDYERGSGTIGMPVLTKLKVKRLKDLQGKFAIITIGNAREVFQTGNQSLILVRKIGHPECVRDIFLREDEPNDEGATAVNIGKLKQNYCASVRGEIEAMGVDEARADVDRYRVLVKESLVFDSMLTHGEDIDFDLMIVAVEGDEILQVCDGFGLTERCSIKIENLDGPVEIDLVVLPTKGKGSYTISLHAHNDASVLELNTNAENFVVAAPAIALGH